ncbi:MAG: hypothetical protein ACXW20_07220 [Burkholderiales bacterium]
MIHYDACRDFLFQTIEAVISEAGARVALIRAASERDELLSRQGGELTHQPRNVFEQTRPAPILLVVNDDYRS